MRISFPTMNQRLQINLSKTANEIDRLNEAISSQRQMSTISDNPGNMTSALGLRSSLATIKQYQDNLKYGDMVIQTSEKTLYEIKDTLMRARVLAINSVNGALTAENRAAMAKEVGNIFKEAVTLANTQLNGKYIFAGYRTTGYDATEPTPFMSDKADGYRITGKTPAALNLQLTGTVSGAAIATGGLAINGVDLGVVGASAGATDGLFMDSAAAIVGKINGLVGAGVSASLTTQLQTTAFTDQTAGDETYDFSINGVSVSTITVTGAATAAEQADLFVSAINAISDQTGVTAVAGDGANGGVAGGVVLRNAQIGDSSAITISGYAAGGLGGDGVPGDFADALTSAADATHNTGQVSIAPAASGGAFVISTGDGTDTNLAKLGIGGGGKGFGDEADDGTITYGYRLAAGDLKINGVAVPAASDDGYSTAFADSSAEAKATAINAVSDDTGVTAVIIPVWQRGSGAVQDGTMNSGDLVINGVDIFDTATDIVASDTDNVFIDAINAKTAQTGITATRDSDGRLLLTAINTPTANDGGAGRNLVITTSTNGEKLSHLNGGSPVAPQSKVYVGAVQLQSTRKFMMETTPTSPNKYEAGLATLGLGGGEAQTSESGDVAGDGKLTVATVAELAGSVRYAGDRNNDIAVKITATASLEIGRNGQDLLMDSGTFSALDNLQKFLVGEKFSTMTSLQSATSTTAMLDSGDTGLTLADEIYDGAFTVTVTDHAVVPPREFAVRVPVDVSADSPDSLAAKINGVPGVTASWNADGYLDVTTDDTSRYTVSFSDDSSFFLKAIGLTADDVQTQALQTSLSQIDAAISTLDDHITDFGSRSNRVEVQNRLYDHLELSTAGNLSELEDLDLLEALMKLSAKQVAYEAALSTAAKTMQISLVNFL